MSSGGKTAREVEKLAPTSFTWSVDFGFLTVHEKQQQQYQLLQSGAKLPETKDEKDHPSCPVLSCAAGFSLAETLHLFPQELHSTAVFLEPEADGSCVPGGRFLVSLGSQAFLHPATIISQVFWTNDPPASDCALAGWGAALLGSTDCWEVLPSAALKSEPPSDFYLLVSVLPLDPKVHLISKCSVY
ncbi:uncharacterized protein [Vicugna pacos]|uniref:Uncharacterized protein isoform X3 n=1 Tax=Vicugna pacos TaxID=30538 RepID=A0ABM5E5M7_VICPA